jgi:hypothetical protein
VRFVFFGWDGDAVLVTPSTALQDSDLLHMIVARNQIDRVAAMLSNPPEESS